MALSTHTLSFISMPGTPEMIVILVIGLLIFGRRLPDVGRSIGKTVVEFRKGIREVEDDMKSNESSAKSEDSSASLPADESQQADARAIATGPIHKEV